MTGNCHVRCGAGENSEIISKNYLSLFGTIPNFDKLIATMRSMEISANVIIQNTAQLKAMYEKTHEVIMGNCDSFIFLGGKEQSTLKMISELLGKETIDVVSQNRSKGHRNNSTSINNSIQGRELMTQDELSVMPIDRCVVMVRAFHPFYCHKFDIEKHCNYPYIEDSNKAFAYIVEEKAKTLQMPEIVYNEEDHYAEIETTETEITSVHDILKNGIKEADEIMADIDIPEDDENWINETDSDSSDFADEYEEFSEFNSISDFEDEPVTSDDITSFVLDNKSPDFDVNDDIIYDSGLFFED